MQEMWVWSLGWEDILQEVRATHTSIPAWEIPWTEEPGGLQSTGSQRVRQGLATEWKQKKRCTQANRQSSSHALLVFLSTNTYRFSTCIAIQKGSSPLPHSISGDGSPCLWRLPMLTYPLLLHNHHVPKAHFHQSLSLIKTKWNKWPKSHTHTHTHIHTHTHESSLNRSVCRIKHNPLQGTQNVHSVAPFYLSSLTSNSLPTYNLCDAKMGLQLCPRQVLGFPPSLALPSVCPIWLSPTVHILPVLAPTSVFRVLQHQQTHYIPFPPPHLWGNSALFYLPLTVSSLKVQSLS